MTLPIPYNASHDYRPPKSRTVQAAVRRLRRYAAEQVFGWEPPSRRGPFTTARRASGAGWPQPVRRTGAIDTSLRGRHRV